MSPINKLKKKIFSYRNFEDRNNPVSVILVVPIRVPIIVHVPRVVVGTTVGAPLRGRPRVVGWEPYTLLKTKRRISTSPSIHITYRESVLITVHM